MLNDTVRPGPKLKVEDGMLVFWDTSRSKWLSPDRSTISFGLDNNNIGNDRWMKMTGSVYSLSSGYRMMRNATITGISIQMQLSASCTFRLMKNGNPPYQIATEVTSVGLTLESNKIIDLIDEDINSGDWLQVHMNVTSGVVNYPEIMIEYCYRK